MKSKDVSKKSQDENESKIKKIIIAIILFIIILILLFFVFRTPKYDIIFDSNGGTEISSLVVEKDGKITEPEDPVRDGYSFAGWYYNDKLYDFSKPVTKDMELEARWVKLDDAEGIKFEQEELNLNTGDTDLLEVIVSSDNTEDVEFNWSSSDSSVVSVDVDGNIKALKAGSATITATTKDGKYTATIKVTVSDTVIKPTMSEVGKKVTSVSLDKTNISLNVNDKTKLTATIAPGDAANKGVTWTSSDSSVATVDANGNITALKEGTTTITVKTNDGGYTANCTVIVSTVKVTGISLEQTKVSLEVNESTKLSAIIIPSNATNKGVTWTSSDPNVAVVDEEGNVKALQVGTAIIMVTSNDGKYTAKVTVTVNEISVTGVTLDKTSLTLMNGDSESLVATITPNDAADKAVTWMSSDSSVATVDTNGNITALKVGAAVITVKTNDGGYTADCTVVVNDEVDVDALVESAYETIDTQAATDKFVATLNGTDIEIMIVDTTMSSVDALAGTGVATAVIDFLKTEGIKSVTLSYNNASLEVSEDNLDEDAINDFLKEIGNSAADLVGKEITATVSFEEGYKTANSSEFTISFTEEEKVNVESLVKDAYETISDQTDEDKFLISLNDETINVMLNDLTMSSVDALAGTGIAPAVTQFLKTEGIESVTLVCGDASLEVSEDNLDKDTINNFFKEIGNSAADLVGKEITATVSFEEGYKALDKDNFKIKFSEVIAIDVDGLVESAYETINKQTASDKFIATLNGTDIEIMIVDTTMSSVDALAGTGVATAVTDFLKTEGIESVTLSYNNASLEVSEDNLDEDAINDFLKEIGNSAAYLVGKEITATVSFDYGYKTANSSEFTISFTDEEIVDVESLVEEAYGTIKEQSTKDKFLVVMDENIKVILVDLTMSSIDALSGTGIAPAVTQFLKTEGIESVTLVCGDALLKVSEDDLDKDTINNFFKEIGNSAADLVGKEITATVSFEEGYKALDGDSFVVEFAKVEKVDVDTLVNNAYETVKKQADTDKFIVSLDETDIEIMIVDTTMTSVDALVGTGVATAVTQFLETEGIESVTLSYNNASLEVSEDNLDEDAINDFLKEIGNSAAYLVGKEITATVSFDYGYKTANSSEFTINFTEAEKVDVETQVEEAYKAINKQTASDKFIASLDGTKIEIMIIDTTMTSVDALTGTGVATAVTQFLETEGIKSVTLSYNNALLEISEDNLDTDAIEVFLKEMGSSSLDLVGKEITATVSFDEGYKTLDGDSFVVMFTEEEKVDVNNTLENAYDVVANKSNDIFDSELTNNIIKVSLKKFNVSSVDALAGSGIAEAVISFLDTKGIEAVVLNYGDANFEVNKNNLDKDAINAFFKEIGNSTADLVGKEITATVSFKTGYKTMNISSFIVSFDEKKYDVNFYVDGSVVSTSSVRAGDSVVEINYPTKNGYTFDKWLLNGSEYNFATPVTESIDLEASWTINSYKINIVSNDSTMGSVNVSEVTADYGTEIVVSMNTITIGDTVIKAMPAAITAQYAYSFVEWSNVTTSVVGEMTITANFTSEVNSYFVIYKDENGRTLDVQDIEYGTLVSELTAPAKTGYVAVGFVGVDSTTQITGDTTLVVEYAKELNVTETLGTNLEGIDSPYYSASIQESANPLDNDTIVTEFSSSDLIFSDIDFALGVIELLETIADEEKYQSVKLSYNNDPTQQLELTGSVNIINVARFVGLVGAGSYSGSLGLEVTIPQLVTATANKPITVTILLNDDYATPEGERTVVYDLVFTCKTETTN